MRDVGNAARVVFASRPAAQDSDTDSLVTPPEPSPPTNAAGKVTPSKLAKATAVFQAMADELTSPSDEACEARLTKMTERSGEGDTTESEQGDTEQRSWVGVSATVIALLQGHGASTVEGLRGGRHCRERDEASGLGEQKDDAGEDDGENIAGGQRW